MRKRKLLVVERPLYVFDQMSEPQASVNVFLRPPDFLCQGFDSVGVRLHLHEGCVATGFVQFVYVGALEVFDELQFEALGVGVHQA
jgi:hypothetical protein